MSEIADLAGVERSTVSNWRKRHAADFPRPVAGTPSGPHFALADVQAWLRRHGRQQESVDAGQRLWSSLTIWRGEQRVEDLIGAATSLLTWRRLSDLPSAESSQSAPSPVTPTHDWRTLASEDPTDLPAALAAAVNDLEFRRPELRDVFQPLVSGKSEPLTQLFQVIDTTRSDAIVGMFEELVIQHRRSAGKAGGEWSSTDRLTELLMTAANPSGGTVYDPAAGTGGFLVAAGRGVAGLRLAGQEANEAAWRLAVQRLLIHELDGHIALGDTLLDDDMPDLRAEVVMSEPSFGMRWPAEQVAHDPRWAFGMPPVKSVDLLWVQQAIWHLAPGGRAFIVLPANALFRGGQEAKVRTELIRRGALDAVVALPPGYAQSSNIALSLWVVARPDQATDRHHVLLVDAASPSLDADPADIGAAVRGWLEDRAVPKGLSARAVSRVDLIAADSAIVPSRWATSSVAEDPRVVATRLSDRVEALNRCLMDALSIPAVTTLLQAANTDMRRVSIEELLREGHLSLHKGVRVERELLGDSGFPVVMPRDVRHPRADPLRAIDPTELARDPDLTRAGDVLVVTEGVQVSAWVDPEGGRLVASPVQRLRVHSSWLRPDHLAACLTSGWNTRFMIGTTIARAPIGDLQVVVMSPAQQEALADYLAGLASIAHHAERLLGLATTLSTDTVSAVMSGDLTIPDDREPRR